MGSPRRPLVHGYLCLEQPDGRVSSLYHDLTAFCQAKGYRLGSIFIDRGLLDGLFVRTGIIRLLEALSRSEAHGVVVPTWHHLSSQAFIRDALIRMVQLIGSRVVVAHRVNCGESQTGSGVDLGAEAGAGALR
jgi:hypothetical protein